MLVMPENREEAKKLLISLDAIYCKAVEAFYSDDCESFENRMEDMQRSIRDLGNMVKDKKEMDNVHEIAVMLVEKGFNTERLEQLYGQA